MSVIRFVASAAICLNAFSGCERPGTGAKTAVPAAKVAKPVSESQLNSVDLTPEAVERLGVEVTEVELREMRRIRPYGAETALPSGASLIVSAPVTGTLQLPKGRSFPRVGQRVETNYAMLELMPLLSPERSVLTPAERIRFAEARNTVAQTQIDAAGQVEQANVQVEAAKIALTRAKRLLRDQAGTVRAVDEAEAQLGLAQKALEAAQARKSLVENLKLDEAAGTLESMTIRSSMSGIVRATHVQTGEMVAAGAPLFEIMDDQKLWVKVPVYVGDVDEIDQSQPVHLTSLDGRAQSKKFEVRPAEVPPTAAPLAAAVDFYYELSNSKGEFHPGQRLTAHLTLKGEQECRAIPWSAVIHDIYGGQWVYEQVEERKFVRRRVEVGWVSEGWAALVRGPNPPALIVTAGAAELAGTEFGFAK